MSVRREGRWVCSNEARSSVRWMCGPHAALRAMRRLVIVVTPLVIAACAGGTAGDAVPSSIAVPQADGASPILAGSIGPPPARCCAAIGFDPETQQVVMFGGLGVTGTRGDTWIWNGSY